MYYIFLVLLRPRRYLRRVYIRMEAEKEKRQTELRVIRGNVITNLDSTVF